MKRGQFDLIEIAITLLVLAMLIILTIYVNGKVTEAFQTKVSSDSLAYQAMDKANLTFQNGLDKLYLGIFIILLIGMVILAFYIQSSVLFLILFVLLSIISTWFAAIISNVYQEVEATGIFASTLIHTPIMTYIMENLPIFIAAFAMILLIITYSKDILFQRIGEPQ